MRSLVRAVGRPDIGGEPLPQIFRTLEDAEIRVRKAELTLIAGVPGAFKTGLALSLVKAYGLPTLYFAADTNELTMATRLISASHSSSQRQVEETLLNDREWGARELEGFSHIVWCFDSSPSLKDIDLEERAFEEVYGQPPELIVIDNLIDVYDDGGDEFGGLRATMKWLKTLARDTGAAVVVLHHTSESEAGHPCQPRKAIFGKVAQLPALILTVMYDPAGYFWLACVKNRHGPCDPSGKSAVWLYADPGRMWLGEPEDR